MAKMSKSKKSSSQPKKQPQRKSEELDDSDEELPDIMALNNNQKNHFEEDEEDDEEVFDLGEDDDDDEVDEEGDEDDDDFEDDEEDDNDLNNLIKNLPASIRQKVISKNSNIDDDSEEDEDEKDQQNDSSWGKKKNYWSADTTDLEIGQDVQDAEDEEDAALELQKQRLEKVNKSDYYDNEEEAEENDNDEEERLNNNLLKSKDLLSKKLSTIANSKEIEFIKKDFSKLTKEEKLDLITTESPELLLLLEDLKEKIDILQSKINPLRNLFEKSAATTSTASALITDELVQYLEVKQQLLLSYCINMLFYFMLKSQGASVNSHPVMRQLLELRYAMEKLRPLDGKLKHQIDRLLSYTPSDSTTATDTMTLRPNPFDLLARDGDEGEDDTNNNSYYNDNDMTATGNTKSKSGIYKAPKLQAMPYKDNEDELDKQKEKLDRKKKKLKNTEILQTLQEEFGHKPEMTSSSGVSVTSKELKQLEEEENERKTFEEDRFVRLTLSKKDKKSIKKRLREASTLEGLGVTDIGDINEFDDFATLSRSVDDGNARLGRRKEKNQSMNGNGNDDTLDEVEGGGGSSNSSSITALQRAVNAFALSASSSSTTNKKNDIAFNDDYDLDQSSNKKNKIDTKSATSLKRKGGGAEADNDLLDIYNNNNEDDGDNDFDTMLKAHSQKKLKQKPARRPAPDMSFGSGFNEEFNGNGDEGEEEEEGEGLVALVSRQKKAFAELKKDHYTPAPKYGGVEEDARFNNIQGDDKRAASHEIIANRGLTPHRNKDSKNPRVKKRKAFEKATKARKGQVQDVIVGAAGSYGGEQTGIKANISKSRKITN